MENNYIEDSISYVEEIEDLFDYVSERSGGLEKRSRNLIGFGRLFYHSLNQDIEKYSSETKII